MYINFRHSRKTEGTGTDRFGRRRQRTACGLSWTDPQWSEGHRRRDVRPVGVIGDHPPVAGGEVNTLDRLDASMDGRVRSIHIAPEQGAEPEPVEEVAAVAGAGLRGDRYFVEDGTFADRPGSDLTLIEGEALAAVERDYGVELAPGVHRRNVTTEGVRLNHLVDRRFRVGDAVCLGTELCEPCSYLERHLAKQGVREALVHRGGLRCRVVDGGRIRVGDAVHSPENAAETDG